MSLSWTIKQIARDYSGFYPKALIVFGSAARYLLKIQAEEPQDIDLLFVGSIKPFSSRHYAFKHDLFHFYDDEIISIAKSLRYNPKSVSRAKMYMRDSWDGIVRSDIASCLLLGSSYQAYGFLQMENEAQYRDYSIHTAIHGEKWWHALQAYAQEYRGLKGLMIDKALGLDKFER